MVNLHASAKRKFQKISNFAIQIHFHNSSVDEMFRNLPPVTKNLLIINTLVWLATLIPSIQNALLQYCALYYVESPYFGAWQLVTYMFLHVDFTHLFFNMFALLMFGGIIEWTLGSKRFLVYYLSCGIGAALIQEGVFALMFIPDHELVARTAYVMSEIGYSADPAVINMAARLAVPTLGASGAIYGILLAFGMLYPNREIYLMFIPVGIKAKWMVIGYGVLELAMGLGGSGDGVAHFAHLGGMIFGFLLLLYWKKRGDFNTWG